MADAEDTTTADEILSYFQATNIEPHDRNVIDKCVELCRKYDISAEDFVDQYMAYTLSYLNGAPPTLVSLAQLERKELQKQLLPTTKEVDSKHEQQTPIDNDDEVIATASLLSKQQFVPIKSQQQEKKTVYTHCSDALLQVLFTYRGSSIIQDQENCGNNQRIAIKLYGVDGDDWLTADNVRYMFNTMKENARAIDDVTERIADAIATKHQLIPSTKQLRDYFGEMCVFGRIHTDSQDTCELNWNSVVFEGTSRRHNGYCVNLILKKLNRYALFSGQIVVIEGLNNIKENHFICNRIYTDASLVTTQPPRGGCKIIVAAGPFTMPDNLEYEPFNDLIQYVCKNPPDLLILLGPFIDNGHKLLIRMNEEFETLFDRLLNRLIDALDKVGAVNVQIVVVPSERDAHNHPIFPTPPYKIDQKSSSIRNNYLFAKAPNPCILDVCGGLIVAATSTDVLRHLNERELFFDRQSKTTTNVARLIRYLFNQRTFYPLYPSEMQLSVDYPLFAKYGRLDCRPHLLILPSTLPYFVIQVDGCLVVNSERLVKELVAGTFARIQIGGGGGDGNNSICDRTTCQILRI